MQPIELYGGIIRVSPYLLALDVLLLIHFAYSYYKYSYAKGFKVDYWHFTAFIGFVLPILLLYPFAGSWLNAFSIRSRIFRVQEMVDRAFIISVVGYICVYVGFYYYNLTQKRSLPYALANSFNRCFVRYVYNCIESKASLYVCSACGLIPAVIFLAVAFAKYGVTMNLRGETLSDPAMRAFFNLIIASYLPVVNTFLLIRYLQYREKTALMVFVALAAVTFFSGSRGAVFSPILMAVVFYLISRQHRIKLIKYIIAGCVLLILAFFLKDVRSGRFSPMQTIALAPYSVAYGNNFSDMRDFANILSHWDNEYLLGKSYLAAGLAWAPRGLYEFKEKWAIGLYILRTLGLDPTETTGRRPGKFGEPYLNFGFAGVMLIGFIGGYVLRFVDAGIKEAVLTRGGNLIELYSLTFVYFFASQFYLTGSFRRFFAFVGILVLGYTARQTASILFRRGKNADIG